MEIQWKNKRLLTNCLFFDKMRVSQFVRFCIISWGIWQVLIWILHFWVIQKKCPDRSRPSRMTICLRFAIFIFPADALKAWFRDAILVIFELPAGEVLKLEMLLKPLVGTRFCYDRDMTTNVTICTLNFSLGGRQNCVKIVTSLESQWPSQVQGAQQ